MKQSREKTATQQRKKKKSVLFPLLTCLFLIAFVIKTGELAEQRHVQQLVARYMPLLSPLCDFIFDTERKTPSPTRGSAQDTPTSSFYATVQRVGDGDTFDILYNQRKVSVRLYGVDCPELHQDKYGALSLALTSTLALHQAVLVQPMGNADQYGRIVAIVEYSPGKTVQEKLLQDGLAWVYNSYCKTAICAEWEKLEKQAQGKRVGLWETSNPLPPWEWRKQNPRR